MEMLKKYAFKQSWSQSLCVEKILKGFLDVEIGNKTPVKVSPKGPYIDTPEDKEAGENFLKNMEEKKGKKSAEDLEFEKSIADTMKE